MLWVFDSFSEFLVVDRSVLWLDLLIFMQIHFLLSFPYILYKRWKKVSYFCIFLTNLINVKEKEKIRKERY